MRILHLPVDVAGHAGTLARATRALGHESDLAVLRASPFGYATQTVVGDGLAARLRFFRRVARRYDVFHYHYGTSLLPLFSDVRLLRAMGKTVVMHFYGSDIRPYDLKVHGADVLEARGTDARREAAKKARTLRMLRLFHATLVCDAESQGHAPGSRIVRQALELPPPPAEGPPRARPVVVHAPSSPAIKGTRHVLAAVEALRKEGVDFEFRLLQGVPHSELQAFLAGTDVVVDQLILGVHGVFAVEAMAQGKPVVCHVAERYRAAYGGVPLVDATPATLTDVLRGLLASEERRREIGRASRRFVEEHHDARRIAERLVETYRELGAPP